MSRRIVRPLMIASLVIGGILTVIGAAYTVWLFAQPPLLDVVPNRELPALYREEVIARWLTFWIPVAGLVLLSFGAGLTLASPRAAPPPPTDGARP